MPTPNLLTAWATLATVDQVGSVACPAAGQTVVVPNAIVTAAASLVMLQLATDDATAKSCVVSAQANGSFTIKFNAAPTADVVVNYYIIGLS